MFKFIALLFISLPTYADGIPKNWQLGFQEAASPVMQRLASFHDYLLIIIFGISIFVLLLLAYVCIRFSRKNNPTPSKTTHNVLIEIIWTLIPALILVSIAIPSFKNLYYMDKDHKTDMSIKVVAHQWYWSYEYNSETHGDFGFDSYMINDSDIKPGQIRLLDVDNPVVLPVETDVKIIITSADVIHSWAIPALGIKIDAIPGRVNETWLRINKKGTYYGQCSELCGTGHGFMPIAIRAVEKEEYNKWLAESKSKFS